MYLLLLFVPNPTNNILTVRIGVDLSEARPGGALVPRHVRAEPLCKGTSRADPLWAEPFYNGDYPQNILVRNKYKPNKIW